MTTQALPVDPATASFVGFFVSKAFDVISEGNFKKHLIQSRDLLAASSIFTTRNPAHPSLKGVLPSEMQLTK